MDADRFDAVARAVSAQDAASSRRGALSTLLTTGLGLLAIKPLPAPGDVSARKNGKKANGR